MNSVLFSAESLDRLILNRFNLCHLILNGLITQGANRADPCLAVRLSIQLFNTPASLLAIFRGATHAARLGLSPVIPGKAGSRGGLTRQAQQDNENDSPPMEGIF
jgi:hypothetical protein